MKNLIKVFTERGIEFDVRVHPMYKELAKLRYRRNDPNVHYTIAREHTTKTFPLIERLIEKEQVFHKGYSIIRGDISWNMYEVWNCEDGDPERFDTVDEVIEFLKTK